MRTLAIAGLLFATSAAGDPYPDRSQHPRNGLLASLGFAVDSSELVWGANRKLGRVAAWANANPTGIIVLEGHSDPSGAADHNLELSVRRALTARRELVEAGISPHQLVIVGFGEQGPPRDARRTVKIWATRNDLAVVVNHLHKLGAPVVRPGSEQATSVVGQR